MTSFSPPGQAIILYIDGHPAGRLLSTDAKEVIPHGSGESVWLCTLPGGRSLIDWLASTVNSTYSRRDVKLTIVDQVHKTGTELNMFDCLLSKVTLPALDSASSAAAAIRLVVKPERSRTSTLGDIQDIPILTPKAPSKVREFEFLVDGIDDAKFVQRVEPITLSVGTKTNYRDGSNAIEPTSLSESNIVVKLPAQHGAGFLKWSDETRNGNSRGVKEKTGAVRYLANGSLALQANLYELSITSATKSGPLLTVEMVCSRMEIQGTTFTL